MTRTELMEWLDYQPASGVFTWRKQPRLRTEIGSVAGSRQLTGYLAIGLRGRKYLAHRLAWLFVNGRWPDNEIDHINGDRGDNRAKNLRDATRTQNGQNTGMRSDNKAGIKGVDWYVQTARWRASITVCGRRHHLGYFATKEEAAAAYREAAAEHFGSFARAA